MNGSEAGLPSGYGLYLFQTILALGAVCLLAWVVLRYGVKRLFGASRRGALLRIVERLPLEPRRSVFLVEVNGRYVLLGTGEAGVRFLADIEPERVDLARIEATDSQETDKEEADEEESEEIRKKSTVGRSPAPE